MNTSTTTQPSKPSAQPNAGNNAASGAVCETWQLTNPSMTIGYFDHIKDNDKIREQDLYAGDVSLTDFMPKLQAVAALMHKEIRQRGEIVSGGSTAQAKFVKDFLAMSDDEHKQQWKAMFKKFSMNNVSMYEITNSKTRDFRSFGADLETIALKLVDEATKEIVTPGDEKAVQKRRKVSFPELNRAVKYHLNLASKGEGRRNLLKMNERIKDAFNKKGKILAYRLYQQQQGVPGNVFINTDYAEKAFLEYKKHMIKVSFNRLKDKFQGLGIMMNGTMGYHVVVTEYKCKGKDKFSVRYCYRIYDHFGLDDADISVSAAQGHMTGSFNGIYYDARPGFLSWYYLQRVKGYLPIVLYTENEYVVDKD